MPRLIPEHFPAVAVEARRKQAEACIEPTQIDGEQLDGKPREEEGRQRNAEQRKHRSRVIDRAVLIDRRPNAERNGDEELEDGRNERDHKRNPHVLRDNLPDGLLVFERHAQIAL